MVEFLKCTSRKKMVRNYSGCSKEYGDVTCDGLSYEKMFDLS